MLKFHFFPVSQQSVKLIWTLTINDWSTYSKMKCYNETEDSIFVNQIFECIKSVVICYIASNIWCSGTFISF